MRQVYRIELTGTFHMRGLLRLSEGVGVEGKLTDISAHGASLVFLSGSDPKLEIGYELAMVFSGPNGLVIETEAAVRSRYAQDEYVRYGFEFLRREELQARIPYLMRAVFNRRRAPRVAPESPIEVTLEPEGAEPLKGSLADVSVSGAGIEVPFLAFEKVPIGRTLKASFALPGCEHPVRVVGTVRGHRTSGPSVHVGIEFEADQTRDFPSQQAMLENYVSLREVETPFIPA